MEFDFDVNTILPDIISAFSFEKERNYRGHAIRQRPLENILDKLGIASAKAQSLEQAVTSYLKLVGEKHHIYILKDAVGPRGWGGAVVGFIKVGYKSLFVLDLRGNTYEMRPLCVLDFYVHESRQRRGHGRQLFDFMLQNQDIKAEHLAIDRPSPKFQGFLAKHYAMTKSIPQTNNFAVYDGFFDSRTDSYTIWDKETNSKKTIMAAPKPARQHRSSLRRNEEDSNFTSAVVAVATPDQHNLGSLDGITLGTRPPSQPNARPPSQLHSPHIKRLPTSRPDQQPKNVLGELEAQNLYLQSTVHPTEVKSRGPLSTGFFPPLPQIHPTAQLAQHPQEVAEKDSQLTDKQSITRHTAPSPIQQLSRDSTSATTTQGGRRASFGRKDSGATNLTKLNPPFATFRTTRLW